MITHYSPPLIPDTIFRSYSFRATLCHMNYHIQSQLPPNKRSQHTSHYTSPFICHCLLHCFYLIFQTKIQQQQRDKLTNCKHDQTDDFFFWKWRLSPGLCTETMNAAILLRSLEVAQGHKSITTRKRSEKRKRNANAQYYNRYDKDKLPRLISCCATAIRTG